MSGFIEGASLQAGSDAGRLAHRPAGWAQITELSFGIVMLIFAEERLFFASAERVVADVLNRLAQVPGTHPLIVSLEESAALDSTALECLRNVSARTRHRVFGGPDGAAHRASR